MRLTTGDVDRFAAWSHDRNPLHTEPGFGRQTFFGQNVAHGALALIKAIGECGWQDRRVEGIEIEFRHAIFVDTNYEVEKLDDRSWAVSSGQTTRLSARLTEYVAPATKATDPTRHQGDEQPILDRAVERSLAELARGVAIWGKYPFAEVPDDYLDAIPLTPLQVRILGLCSYLVGMQAPGYRSLFTGLKVLYHAQHAPPGELTYELRSTRFVSELRMLFCELDVTAPDGSLLATGEISAYVPFSPAVPDTSIVAAYANQRPVDLSGKVAVVCGGSRGLGAQIVASLVLARCKVYALSRGDSLELNQLRKDLESRDLGFQHLLGDVGDLAWCRAIEHEISEEHGGIDILVLNACAPPIHYNDQPAKIGDFGNFISRNLPLVESPFGAFIESVNSRRGQIVVVSSEYVKVAPAGMGHYVALKQAAEALTKAQAKVFENVTYLVVRPPMLQTSWNDTPTAVAGAIRPLNCALTIIDALTREPTAGSVEVVDDFLRDDEIERTETAKSFTVAVCATFTIEPLEPGLRFWFDELGMSLSTEISAYNQVMQELVNPSSLLNSNASGANLVVVRVLDWLRDKPPATNSVSETARFLEETAKSFIRAMRTHRENARCETALLITPSSPTPNELDTLIEDTEHEIVGALTDVSGLSVVRATDFSEHYLLDPGSINDPLRDEIAHIPYSDAYMGTLATIAVRTIYRPFLPLRKAVVVDCDNTLWKGVVGEDGWQGIEFLPEHHALHQFLRRVVHSGVLVCVCSKNVQEDVWEVFERRDDMTLRRDQIVAAAINWDPKSDNLRMLAERLNLGLDSFCFIDDNPVECAEVRSRCPEVLTLQWPKNTDEASSLLAHLWEFDLSNGTEEDRRRTQLYRDEYGRKAIQEEALSFDEFIANLELQIVVEPITKATVPRASQMTMRTNQFNFTTIRRTESEIAALLESEEFETRILRVSDRFGDYGIVGLIIARVGGATLDVDTFLMSCRVLGRGVEHKMAVELANLAQLHHLDQIALRVDTTLKNLPARKFLQTITPRDELVETESGFSSILSVDHVRNLTYDPNNNLLADDQAVEEGSIAVGAVHARGRERQIARAAFELGSADLLQEAISSPNDRAVSVAVPLGESDVSKNEVANAVYEAFARALNCPREQVEEIDELDALGCESFQIVNITVALKERFGWLPATLLFEHGSVSAIVTDILGLANNGSDPDRRAATTPAPTDQVLVGDVAVVGIGVRCAGANDTDELWELLSRKGSAVQPVQPDREYLLGRLRDERPHWAGQIDGIDRFDADLFGVSPREARWLDPQLRLFMEVAWEALDDAGFAEFEGYSETGVFVGVMYSDYVTAGNRIAARSDNPFRVWEGFSLANRFSQFMGFEGPSIAINTACSSSATALHQAVLALKNEDCRTAVVGGVNLILDPDRFVQLGRLGILSENGECRPFGAAANGTVLGEGAGVVVIKRLDDAVRDADHIYGVIKGSALSTGAGSVGFTAPNPVAQSIAIEKCLQRTGLDPRTISYVETHGTGTSLGDPIEIRGLSLAYENRSLWDSSLALQPRHHLGSIKANVGHLEAGAGIMGLIKVLLQLDRQALLPTLTSPEPNPQIDFRDGLFAVPTELTPWLRPAAKTNGENSELPRRAALNSFGVGGSNVHVIVEEAPPCSEAQSDGAALDDTECREMELVMLTAPSAAALRNQAQAHATYVESNPHLQVRDIAHSLVTTRRQLEHRVGLVVSDRANLVDQLLAISVGRPGSGVRGRTRRSLGEGRRTAFLFTGQGAQYVGMGKELMRGEPVYRQAFEECCEAFAELLEYPLEQVVFAEEGSAHGNLVNQTAYTQPALFSLQYALAQLWMSWGIKPDLVLGHSIGEFAAYCVAGGISLEDVIPLVAARGRLMQGLPEGGAMMSVRCDEASLAELISPHPEHLSIAAINTPDQIVVSGDSAKLEAVLASLEARSIEATQLKVSHAFHSPLMEPMLEEFRSEAGQVTIRRTDLDFLSTVDAQIHSELDADYWVEQIRKPVRFAEAIAAASMRSVDDYIEVGPHPVLTSMAKACLPNSGASWLISMRRGESSTKTILENVARRATDGGNVDWQGFNGPFHPHRVKLPSYAFDRKSYWLDPELADAAAGHLEICAPETGGAKAYQIDWQEGARDARNADGCKGSWLLIGGGEISRRVSELLRIGGSDTATIETDTSMDSTELAAAVRAILTEAPTQLAHPAGVVFLHEPVVDDQPDSRSIEHQLEVCHALSSCPAGVAGRLWIVTRGAVATGRDRNSSYVLSQGALWGFGRVFALEEPDRWGGLIDLDPAGSLESDAEFLLAEIGSQSAEDQVAHRDGRRLVPRFEPMSTLPNGSMIPRADATYLITGGLGVLGRHCARWLTAKGVRHLVLAGRRGIDTPNAQELVAELAARDVEIDVMSVDMGNVNDINRLLAHIDEGGRRLAGIIHAAGTDQRVNIESMSQPQLRSVFDAKAIGAWTIHTHPLSRQLDFLILFSSMSAVLGSIERAHYASANAALDLLAHERNRLDLPTLSVDWGPWTGGGMANEQDLAEMERLGNHGLDPAACFKILERLLASKVAQAVAVDIEWARFGRILEARRPKMLIHHLVGGDTGSDHVGGGSQDILGRLADCDPVAQNERLKNHLRQHIANVLEIDDAAGVDIDEDIFDMGVDSYMAVEFATTIEEEFKLDDSLLVLDYPTVNTLANALLKYAEGKGLLTANSRADSHQIADSDDQMADYLRSELAQVLGHSDVNQLPKDENLFELGLDSLTAVEFLARIQEQLAVATDELALGEHSITTLAQMIGRSGVNRAVDPTDDGGIAGYSPDLEPLIDRFQETAWPERGNPGKDVWRWMFLGSAERMNAHPLMWLFRDKDSVVGETGGIRVKVQLGKEQVDAAWFVDSMVLPEYRPKAVGSRLLLRASRETPFALSLGQEAYMRQIQLQSGWQAADCLGHFVYPIRPDAVLRSRFAEPLNWLGSRGLALNARLRQSIHRPRLGSRPETSFVDRFGTAHDDLWNRVGPSLGTAVVRDASYLNWKYVDRPSGAFTNLELRCEGELAAVAVLAFMDPDDVYAYRRAFLVDLVLDPSDRAVVWGTLDAVRELCADRGADAIHLYLTGPLTREVVAFGCLQRESTKQLLIHMAGSDTGEKLARRNQWFLTMGDCDLDRPLVGGLKIESNIGHAAG